MTRGGLAFHTIPVSALGRVITGKTPPSSHAEMFGDAYPFITPTDIDGVSRRVATEQFLSDVGRDAQKNLILPANAVCFVSIGATIGKTCITSQPSFTDQQINSIVVDATQHDPHFVYHLLRHEAGNIKKIAGGAATPIVNKTAFSAFAVSVPNLQAQRSIGSILSAYDDLIENNTRRIQILEKMAQAIYREWFVHFRFPGHEKVKLVDSPMGRIPHGWTTKPLRELVSFLNRGISPAYAENGASVVINQRCIRDQRLDLKPARRQSRPVPEERLIRFGDVLINSPGVGTLGRVAQVYRGLADCTVDNHVTIVRPTQDLDIDFFGCAMLGLQETFERLGVGATGQTELGRKAIEQVAVPISSSETQSAFGQTVHPMRMLADRLSRTVENLRRTRDLLLPKLISGEIGVSGLDVPQAD